MNEDLRLHPVSLRFFNRELEEAFQESYFRQSLDQARMALIMGLVMYMCFGLLDSWMVPGALTEIRLIRLTVCILLSLLLASTFASFFRRHMQAMLMLAPLVGGLGVTAMGIVAQHEATHYQHYVGLMLIFFFVHVLLRLRFAGATAVSWFVIGAYDAVALWLLDTPMHLFIINNFFLIGANVSGMVASYLLERYAREVFWNTRLLEEKHQQLATENQRKTQELEEARQIQRAMLPRSLPVHPLIDLAAYTLPATEVGGDYYDYTLSEDGTFTFAIGDATGHGAQASAMVTATKVLFAGLAHEEYLPNALQKASRILKRAGLGKRYMALALGRLTGTTLDLAGAGMPPALLYRAASGTVEEIALKGPPLGSFPNFPYHQTRLELASGDMIVLMSDGLPELFNANDEPFGYDRVSAFMKEAGDVLPEQLIMRFVEAGTAWRTNRPQSDDVTFLALRVKPGASDTSLSLDQVSNDLLHQYALQVGTPVLSPILT